MPDTQQAAPVPAGATVVPRQRTQLAMAWRALSKDRMALVGGAIIILVLLISVFAPWLAPYDPSVGDGTLRLMPPGTPGHLLGLDDQGRDILTRLIYGGRISLSVALIPVTINAAISLVLGLFAGFSDSIAGEAVMRVLDVFFAFPMVLLAIAISSVLGPGMMNAMLSVSIVLIPYMTRVVYTATLQERSKDYVETARASGATKLQLLFDQVMPNVLSDLIVYATTLMGLMIVFAAGLSFLGLGIQPPAADWGRMTADGRTVLTQGFPHVATIPGLVILIVSLAFNMLGDGLRDALDPYLRTK